jgi:hypothetical protein
MVVSSPAITQPPSSFALRAPAGRQVFFDGLFQFRGYASTLTRPIPEGEVWRELSVQFGGETRHLDVRA